MILPWNDEERERAFFQHQKRREKRGCWVSIDFSSETTRVDENKSQNDENSKAKNT